MGGTAYYGYENDLMDQVRDTFARFDLDVESNNVKLVPGLFQDTIAGDEPVALAHIDGDWYDSVRTCLDRIGPRLVVRWRHGHRRLPLLVRLPKGR